MSEFDHERLTEIFAQAAQLGADEREAYLDRVCAGKPELRREVESLLAHDQDLPAVLEQAEAPDRPRALPQHIGPYHVLEEIGEGGMGVVYLAEQQSPIRRKVAVKRIKLGLETRRVLTRFDSERRVLAMMDHSSIARVLDAGTSVDGRPYFAMEYVPGEPITRYCDRNRLSIAQRLDLFVMVCHGVQHAHQRAIIHRDIKPSNVLVVEVDGRPVPKIIDFGIAKALQRDASDGTSQTEAGQLIGTLEYMSPEQATRDPGEVDTRTDVYALGVLLHELLVGCHPVDPAELRGLPTDEALLRLRTFEPQRLSLRLMRLGPAAEDMARHRATTVPALMRNLRGDLDWITLRALARERAGRYGSAAELASDIRRHQRDEPIEARRPSAAHRTWKFARRHPTAAALVAVLLPLLIGFTVALGFQANRIAAERDRFEQISEFLVDFYNVPFSVSQRYGLTSADEVLRAGVDKVDANLGDRPTLHARMLLAIGRTLRGVGDHALAESAVQRAFNSLRTLEGPEHPTTIDAARELASVYAWQRRYELAESLLVETLETRRRAFGDGDADTLRTVAELANVYKLWGRPETAAPLFEEALDGMRASLGDGDSETLVTASLLASVYLDLRRLDEAESILVETIPRLQHARELGMAIYNLSCVRALQGDRNGAIEALRQAVFEHGFVISFFGDPNITPLFDDPEFHEINSRALAMLPSQRAIYRARARSDRLRGRPASAAATLEALLRDQPLGESREGSNESLQLARIYVDQGRYDEAEPLIRGYLASIRRKHGPEYYHVPAVLWILAQCHFGQNDIDATLGVLDEMIALPMDRYGTRHERLLAQAGRSAILGDREAAIRHLDEAVDWGFREPYRIEGSLVLQSLSGNAEFERIVTRTRARFEYP